uniref:Secreted protein n=1 Tax=Pyxicephalus adspersus TaxID=30357 RepID=A0AAV3B4R7_PYXAD|nr:TPA: hypothetical protein GDO54_000519 [Pyxicephalus adspersus]
MHKTGKHLSLWLTGYQTVCICGSLLHTKQGPNDPTFVSEVWPYITRHIDCFCKGYKYRQSIFCCTRNVPLMSRFSNRKNKTYQTSLE